MYMECVQIMFDRLRKLLKSLVYYHNLIAIKGGTEIEAMSFDELEVMREISLDILPMIVKIGGPEARNDINFTTYRCFHII